jgi:pimeloyl-ACP methyl ester carboxylesterase
MRGYSAGAIPPKPAYHADNLGMDVLGLIRALGYRSAAAVVGHDWGALAANTAALADASCIERLVTLAVPYGTFGKSLLCNGDQQRRSWYMYFFSTPMALPAFRFQDYAFVDRLWRDWSPGLAPDAATAVKETLRVPGVDEAALSYYRQLYRPDELDASLVPLQKRVSSSPVAVPALYLHGADDGCIGVECVEGMAAFFPNGFTCEIVSGCGHFLHLERPDYVNDRICRFLGQRTG